jgi:hypothetical protein
MSKVRDSATRKADALAMLARPAIDVWVATASTSGTPHLVPLSLAWIDERAVIAVEASSVTARNLSASGIAKLAVGPTRDVVMINAAVDKIVSCTEAGALGDAYAGQADWDPRTSAGYVFVVLRPVRLQAWREADEIPGRTLMREGAWLT